MNTIEIGTSGVRASRVALGCMRLKECSVDEAARVIATAREHGIDFFDHADIYGAGECERIFGEALAKSGVRRQDILLQSKCGIQNHIYNFSRQHILAAVEGSLRRLNTDYLDFLLLHRPDALMEPEEVAEAFDALETSGKVRYFGVSNHHPMQIELLKATLRQPLHANQLQFSPVHTGMVDCGIQVNMKTPGSVHHDGMVLDYCRLNHLTIQTWSPYQYGQMDGVFLDSADFKPLNDEIGRLADKKGVGSEVITAAWILRHPANMQLLTGSMNPARIAAISTAPDHPLSREEWYDIYRAAGNVVP